MSLHSKQTTAKGVHTPISFVYADAATRLAATGFDAATDLNKLALDDDTKALFLLSAPASAPGAGAWTAFGTVDGDAIHDNIAGEISAITAKATPTGSDFLLIEDAAAGDAKKSITLADIPSGPPTAHAASHENGGSDEVDVTGLSGALADPQTPTAHAASHQHGGSDEVATATPAANAIPKATAPGTLADGWVAASNVTQHEAALTITESQVTDLDHDDTDAVHDNVAGEIAAVTPKTPLVAADILLVEDSAAANAKKRATVADIRITESQVTDLDHDDADAIHDNVAGEIAALTLATVDGADHLIIEDDSDSDAKKRILASDFLAGASFDQLDVQIMEHWLSGNTDQDEMGSYGWRTVQNGTGNAHTITGEAGHPGILQIEAGTTVNGRKAVHLGTSPLANVIIGGTNQIEFEALLKFTGSIAAVDLENLTIGLGESFATNGEIPDGVYVRFDPSLDSRFEVVASTSSVRSSSGGGAGPVVALATWYRVGFIISDPGGTPSIQLYVNGTAQGSAVTTNIPAIALGLHQKISAGAVVATETVCLIDYLTLKQVTDKED